MNDRDLAKNLLAFYPDLKRLFLSGYAADLICEGTSALWRGRGASGGVASHYQEALSHLTAFDMSTALANSTSSGILLRLDLQSTPRGIHDVPPFPLSFVRLSYRTP